MKQFYYYLLPLLFFSFQTSQAQNFNAKLIELYFANDGYPSEFMKVNSGFYFTAEDPIYGRELWFSDGTLQNTRMVKDIAEGDRDAGVYPLAVLGDRLIFMADSHWLADPKLWISDGTEEGTYPFFDRRVNEMFTFKNKIYFQSQGEAGAELWVTDGTTTGTKLFKDIYEGPQDSNPADFFEFNDHLYFTANNGEKGRELWKSDGTPESTTLLKDINPGYGAFQYSAQVLKYKDHFYFTADDGQIGFELYKSDGTSEGTVLVKDINPSGSSVHNLSGAVTENGIFFTAHDGVNGYEVWKSDGTEAGTVLVKNISQQLHTIDPYVTHDNFIALGNTVFFVANDGVNGAELWKTDGSEEGTVMVKKITPGNNSTWIRHLKKFGDRILFVATRYNDPVSQLWTSNGTDEGTFPLHEVDITTNLSSFNFKLLEHNNKVYFVANSEIYGHELWVTDGTPAGTKLFKDFDHSWSSFAKNFYDLNGLMYFSSRKYSSGNTLFISNGSVEGTKRVKEITEPDYYAIHEESQMIGMNGKLIFSATDAVHGFELWISNGTDDGTQMIKDINPGNKSSITNQKSYYHFLVVGDKLYFMANDGVHGNELWVTDGTSPGTKMVKDIYPGSQGSQVSDLVLLNNTIYFRGYDSTGPALWKSDGTSGGTVKIKNLPNFRQLRVVNDRLILIADLTNSTWGAHDLFTSDGTEEGTIHLQNFGGNSDGDIEHMTILNDELYFVAKNKDNYHLSVYKTNGTIEGTRLLIDGSTIAINPDINVITTCGDYVYFIVEKENNYGGTDLWRTAGTPESTIPLVKTKEGVYNYINSLTCFQDDLYFLDGFNNEIWRTDGSPANTKTISFTVDGSSPPDNLVINNLMAGKNVLYFLGSTPRTGEEIYAIQNGNLANLPVVELPAENGATDIFTIQVANETCAGKDNGSLYIEASEENPFVTEINGKTYNFTNDLFIDDLKAGNYSFCITINGRSDFSQCFEFSVVPGSSLEAKMTSGRNNTGTVINVQVDKGTAPFTATIDGKFIGSYDTANFSVLTQGKGTLEISSGKACEGKLAINILEDSYLPIAFPNPATAQLNITVPGFEQLEVVVYLYNGSGQLVSSEAYAVNNNLITVNVEKLNPGIYYAVFKTGASHNIQFVKK